MEKVILVDAHDNVIGEMDKQQAHVEGRLHRAISVLVFNNEGEMLLQQRAFGKYHTPGLWSNACCTHPRMGEDEQAAARRRLQEEMGFDTPLEKLFDFIYRAEFENGLTEHELDHVFIGRFDGVPQINPAEVNDYKFIAIADVKKDVAQNPDNYTAWFRLIVDELIQRGLMGS